MRAQPVLDPCCGAKKFYVDKNDERVLFGDIRREEITQCDGRVLSISPDIQCDFRCLPFEDGSFYLVIFDPPHLLRGGDNSWLVQAYGKLSKTWRDDLRQGFSECFRVLKPNGTLVFKWSDSDVPLSDVLALTPHKPIIAERYGRRKHWIVFLKQKLCALPDCQRPHTRKGLYCCVQHTWVAATRAKRERDKEAQP